MTANIYPDLSSAKIIALDIETCDPSITAGMGSGELRDGFLVGVSLATDDGFTAYYPIAHESGNNLNRDHVLNYVREQLGRSQQIKMGHNLKYDLGYLKATGIEVRGTLYDTQIAEGLLDENRGALGYSLDAISHKYTGKGKDSEMLYAYLAATFGGKPNRAHQAKNIWRAPGDIVRDYAISDVVQPLAIAEKQRLLLAEQGLTELNALENRLLPMMLAMRFRGVRIDEEKVDLLCRKYSSDIVNQENEIYAIFGEKFNLGSHKQLGEMFEAVGIDGLRTATGKLSTNKKSLAIMNHPAARKLLALSQNRTLLSTFLEGYCKKQVINGRLHAELHNLKSDEGGTITGRFSCSNPNLQNIPREGLVRSLFLPEPGELWYSDDYSQIEYRLLVHYARGSAAIAAREAYINNPEMDYHAYVKQIIMDRTGKDIARSHVKNINFGLMYTMGKQALAANLELPISEAEKLFEIYHSSLPYVQETQRQMAARGNQRGYVHTLLKRRRRFDLWEPAKFGDKRPALRHVNAVEKYVHVKRAKTKDALNTVSQGGCADIMKLAMSKIWDAGICDVLGAPLLTVHDELDFSVPETVAAHEAHTAALDIMRNCVKLKVPLLVSSKSGINWGELK